MCFVVVVFVALLFVWWCVTTTFILVVLFASTMIMHNQRKLTGVVKRLNFNAIYAGENMAKFFCMLYNRPEGSIGPLSVKQANIPSQPNLYDCGVIMLKAMEMWDGEDKYNGKSMPEYTNKELSQIRRTMLNIGS
ncbi:uncharacterized protein LOC106758590 [Vigna radiata var. radiata]|uniref:Uncharacterized protein LOC106758590 n=1 Tax=Vigna radiata var. radiata TaxID=3916 RepID=A0A3Q0EYN3_VIGRR|nr:uncharacterized protein LOC106758590 [Vigna radiata var. radiata]